MADRGVDVSALPKEARDQLAELDLELSEALSALTDCSMMASGKVSPAQPTGGRRRRTVDDDPDDRRQRFLERNRAAASRCRQKRKLWVSSLEKKAEELNSMNVSLATVTDTSCVKQKLHRRPTCQYWALPATTGPTARPWCPGC